MKEIELGTAPDPEQLPVEHTIEGEDYYLTADAEDGTYRLLSRTCPHAGGQVQDYGSAYFCPLHMWRFDKSTGACLNIPSCSLDQVAVENRDGRLIAVFG
jgi:nitrite reductase/ring-hydroxylating ferredoxin subunit